MIERIPDFEQFLNHSFQIHYLPDGQKEFSVKAIGVNSSINDCHIMKIGDKSVASSTVIMHEKGLTTHTRRVKPRLIHLPGKHRVVYYANHQ